MCPTVGHISTFSEEATIIKPKQTDFRSAASMWAALSAAVVWLAAIAAYAYEDGMNLFQWTGRFSQVLERPFSIGWMPHTLKFIACGLLLWGDRIFEKCGIGRDEGGDGGKTLEIRGKRRLSARDGGANYQQS